MGQFKHHMFSPKNVFPYFCIHGSQMHKWSVNAQKKYNTRKAKENPFWQ